VATSALRFYEKEGLVESSRTGGGQRRYHREVLRRVAFVRAAQRVGLSLDEIRDALSSLPDGRNPTAKDWERLSRSWRPLLEERIAEMQRLRDRLDSCIGCGCLSLKVCALSNPHDVAAESGPGARYL
jgi:MerR family redox-sensitive transcriptional activator SoxR